MDLPKDVTLFVLREGLEIYGQPDKQERGRIRRIADKARTWYDVWKKNWVIGQTTGQKVLGTDGEYIEVFVVQSDWLAKNFTTGLFGKFGSYIKSGSIGYIHTLDFDKGVYFLAKDGAPMGFGDTVLGGAGTGTLAKDDEGQGTNYDTIIWVLVFVLAMVAGYRALNKRK